MRATALALLLNVLSLCAAVALSQHSLWAGLALGAAAIAAVTLWLGRFEGRIRRAVAEATHELRNPLAVVRGAVEVIRDRASGRLTPREDGFLADGLRAVDGMRRLLVDLGSAAVDPPLMVAQVQVRELLDEAVRDAATRFPGAQVTVSCPEGLTAQADRLRAGQIMANLLANALQQEPAPAVEVTAVEDAAAVVIRVSDRGPGVPAEMRERLFEPFATTGAHRGGSGVGLATSRRLAERMGGALTLIATSPSGATFELRLPLRR